MVNPPGSAPLARFAPSWNELHLRTGRGWNDRRGKSESRKQSVNSPVCLPLHASKGLCLPRNGSRCDTALPKNFLRARIADEWKTGL